VLSRVVTGVLELLAPPSCAACGGKVSARDEPFCPACALLVEPLECEPQASSRAVFRYGGPVADAVRRLKYEGRSEIARALAAGLVDCASAWLGQLDVVLPIPLSASKLRARGYNQSALLARELARGLSVTYRPTWLRRTRAGPRQVGQTRAARLAQIRGAFAAGPQVQGKAVLLVDDVRTTGATLAEASRSLSDAGARSVYTIVLALADDADSAP
jgi:ComF family protein